MAQKIDIQNQAQAFQFAVALNKAIHNGSEITVDVSKQGDSSILNVAIGDSTYVINSDEDTKQILVAVNTHAFHHLAQLNQQNDGLYAFLYTVLHSSDATTDKVSSRFHQMLMSAGYQQNVQMNDVELYNAPNWANLLYKLINVRISAPYNGASQDYAFSTEGSGPGFDINVVIPRGGSVEGAANAFTALVFPEVMDQPQVFRAVQDHVARLFLGYGEVGGGNLGVIIRNGGAKTGVFQPIPQDSTVPPQPRVMSEIQPGETINVNLNRRDHDSYNFKPDAIFVHVPEREANRVTWTTFFGTTLPQGTIPREIQAQYLFGIELKGKDGWSAKFKLSPQGLVVADLFKDGQATQYVNQKDVNAKFTGITFEIPFVQTSGSEALLQTL